MSQREKLLADIQQMIDETGGDLPLLSLDDYFIENNDKGSIAPNQTIQARLSPQEIYSQLKKISRYMDVYTILVGIDEDWDSSLDNPELWPAAEAFYIYTNRALEDVAKWVDFLNCNIYQGWLNGMSLSAPAIPPGYHVYSLYWDLKNHLTMVFKDYFLK